MTTYISNEQLDAEPTAIYQGFDSIGYKVKNTAVVPIKPPVDTTGKSTVSLKITKSLSEVYDAFDISASIAASYAGYSAGAKASFVKKNKISKESICVIVKAVNQSQRISRNDVELSEEAKKITDIDLFVQKYGDAYISEIIKGSEFYALYIFNCETKEQSQTVSASLTASGIYPGGKVEAGVSSAMQKAATLANVSISLDYFLSGFKTPEQPVMSMDGLLEYANKFLAMPIDAPAILQFEATSYEDLIGSDFDAVHDNIEYFTGSEFLTSFEHINQLKSSIEQISKVYKTYKTEVPSKLNDVLKLTIPDLKVLKAQFDAFEEKPSNRLILPRLVSLKEGLPHIKINQSRTKVVGDDNARSFIDLPNVIEAVKNCVVISKIEFNQHNNKDSEYVKGMRTTYFSHLNNKSFDIIRGKKDEFKAIKEDPRGIQISTFDGWAGHNIDLINLNFKDGTNLKIGREKGKKFDLYKNVGNQIVIGFCGSANETNLKQIGLVYFTFDDLQWIEF